MAPERQAHEGEGVVIAGLPPRLQAQEKELQAQINRMFVGALWELGQQLVAVGFQLPHNGFLHRTYARSINLYYEPIPMEVEFRLDVRNRWPAVTPVSAAGRVTYLATPPADLASDAQWLGWLTAQLAGLPEARRKTLAKGSQFHWAGYNREQQLCIPQLL